jgi:hypothetical protein
MQKRGEMDLQSLTQLFATTYDSNPNTRKTGELAVRKVRVLLRDGRTSEVHFVEWPSVLCRHYLTIFFISS